MSALIPARLWTWAAVLRPLKHMVPLETLVRLMHRRPGGQRRDPEFERELEKYLARRGRFPFRPPSNCLERSLAAYRMLCRTNAAPNLVVGVRHSAAGVVEGHVWVTVDGHALAEPPETVASYTTVVTFDAHARRDTASRSHVPWQEVRFD